MGRGCNHFARAGVCRPVIVTGRFIKAKKPATLRLPKRYWLARRKHQISTRYAISHQALTVLRHRVVPVLSFNRLGGMKAWWYTRSSAATYQAPPPMHAARVSTQHTFRRPWLHRRRRWRSVLDKRHRGAKAVEVTPERSTAKPSSSALAITEFVPLQAQFVSMNSVNADDRPRVRRPSAKRHLRGQSTAHQQENCHRSKPNRRGI